MGRLGVKEIKVRDRKITLKCSKDSDDYYLPDSGCKKATEFLGEQSQCKPDSWDGDRPIGGCPFETCKKDSNLTRFNSK